MTDQAPDVSVVIPTHGRPEALLSCLDSLRRQAFPRNRFEIIIVDDATPVPVSEAISNAGNNLLPLVLRLHESRGPGAARNAGVAAARGRLIAFTDDDCLPEPDWLERLWDAHVSQPEAMFGGRIYNAVPDYLGAEASQVIADIVYAWYNADPQSARFFSTNNMAVPRGKFLAMGGFCESFRGASEDRDLCDRWRFAGNRMVFVPQARVGHAHRLTVRKFARQHFGYGRGAATFHIERTARGSGRIQDEMPFHRALPRLALTRLRQERPGRRIKLMGMLGLWQVANVAGYFYETVKAKRKDGAGASTTVSR